MLRKGIFGQVFFITKSIPTYFLGTLTDGLFQVKLKAIKTFNLNERMKSDINANAAINYCVLKANDSTAITTTGFGIYGYRGK
ncbi:MAG: hypothetical protein WDM90_20055 [Ferruginibacter sp.]